MADPHGTLKIGLIGAGGRGAGGYVRYFSQSPLPAELVAVADPSPNNVELCLSRLESQTSRPRVYQDWSEMLDAKPDLDGVIIATPNFLHHQPAMACLNHGVKTLALEKPLATCPDDCSEIVFKADELGVPIQVGFVYRSAPFFAKIKELLRKGTIGKVISIQADEMVSPRTSSVNFRGPWRRYAAWSGGSLLEKCCHDMDLLNWFADSRPLVVSSFGGQAVFHSHDLLPDHCDDTCELSKRCVYFCDRDNMKFPGAGKVEETCIYNSGADVVDHQSVQIYYENGVVCNFMLNFHTSGDRSGRNIHIVGTRGRIWGRESAAHVWSHDMETDEATRHSFTKDSSGHGGGNRTHAEEFLRLAAGHSTKPVVSTYDAYLSSMLCFAADRSRLEQRQVRFRYLRSRKIELD